MRAFKAGVLVCVFLAFPATMLGQTASSAVVLGTVTDATQAVVPGAEVALTDRATNLTRITQTNPAGQYLFASVLPGLYRMTVTAQGFRQAAIPELKVEVAKSYTVNFTLEVGAVTETVEVQATSAVELQMTDAAIGKVITRTDLGRLPTFTRTANELLTAQPLATPAGEVAGARGDQSTFSLDGVDVTNQSVGGLGTYMQLPIDAVEEFRVTTANPNASFGRGAGGQVSIIGRRGANDFHGAAFWYHQNDNLNATVWQNNRTIGLTQPDPKIRKKLQKPELKDNRFGFNVGGPILKDKAFFFAMYEGRRFPRTTDIARLVPLGINDAPVGVPKLREGFLRFLDLSGAVVSYNMATSTLCGSAGTTACDPRSLGLSPSITALWNLLPAANDPTGGDTFNTATFRGIVSNPLENDYYQLRTDYQFSDKWRASAGYRYFTQDQLGSALLDIRGGEGNLISRENFPNDQQLINLSLVGQITPSLTADFSFGWVRVKPVVERLRPNASASLLAIPGTATTAQNHTHIALDLGAIGGTQSLLGEPIDVNTQVARKQENVNQNYQYNADLTWVKGRHTYAFGTRLRNLHTLHRRDDKVLGSLGALVAQLDAQLGSVVIPSSRRPRRCTTGAPTNCLRTSGDETQWSRLLAASLGVIDSITIMMVRDGQFNPLPFGDLLVSDTKLWATEFYFQDTWRATPALTLTFGINYGWQMPPVEKLGRYSIMCRIDSSGNCGEYLTSRSYLLDRMGSAQAGEILNPGFGFQPVNFAARDVFETDWNNLAPRVSAAWNPSYRGGLLGKFFGDRKTVIRGGYSLVYDRQNTVQSVIIPSLGVAFAQTINLNAPFCNLTGPGGAGCNSASGDPLESVFRVGQDGTMPVPTIPTQGIPVVPFWGIRPGFTCTRVGTSPGPCPAAAIAIEPEILSFQVDPSIEVGENHSFDLTWQRELGRDMLLEIGYAGRIARKLPQSMNFGQVPYVHVDAASGQTFAQGFDFIAQRLRGKVPGFGTAVATDFNTTGTHGPAPWFEAWAARAFCVTGVASCLGIDIDPGAGVVVCNTLTCVYAFAEATNFRVGNVNTIFRNLDIHRMRQGLQPFNNWMSRTLFLRSSTGLSNYHAGFATLRRRMSKGLMFEVNYTLSRSLDVVGAIQNAASVMPNSFNLNAEYGPSGFDLLHIFNGRWLYELPFRRSGAVGKAIGGWYVSGIVTMRAGDQLCMTQGSQVWGGSFFLAFASCMVPLVDPDSLNAGVHSGVTGSGTVGINSNPATGGTGLNMFTNPEAAFNSFREVLLSQDGRSGRAMPFKGIPRYNLDLSIGKKTAVTETVNVLFELNFFNALNYVNFNNPSLSLGSPAAFGTISTQNTPADRTNGARWIQFGLRVEF